MAVNVKTFEARLSNGVVKFTFRKRNGELRRATGTRLHNIVKDHVHGGEAPAGVIPFWDMEIGAWRSVRPETIIEII